MVTWDDLEDRLETVEEAYSLSSDGGGPLFLVPDTSLEGYRDLPETELEKDDITVTIEHSGDLEEHRVLAPHYRPPRFQRGLVFMTYGDAAWCWENMPEEIQERELELRCECGDPIPPFLQE